jgi:peptidoglycan/LPS O-acetylase OafA/YrhL
MHFGPTITRGYNKNFAEYKNGFTLGSLGLNHLWTIPCEIKYYFLIPVICLMSTKAGKNWHLLWFSFTYLIFYLEVKNPFGINKDDFDLRRGYQLKIRFSVFFIGSLVAILYFKVKSDVIKQPMLFGNSTVQNLFDNIGLILFILQFKFFSLALNSDLAYYDKNTCLYKYTFIAGLYQSVLLWFLLFVSKTSQCAQLYGSWYFQKCGIYSFGIYLFHPMVIEMLNRANSSSFSINFKLVTQPMFLVVCLTYFVGLAWFYGFERFMTSLANRLCRKLELLDYFQV